MRVLQNLVLAAGGAWWVVGGGSLDQVGPINTHWFLIMFIGFHTVIYALAALIGLINLKRHNHIGNCVVCGLDLGVKTPRRSPDGDTK